MQNLKQRCSVWILIPAHTVLLNQILIFLGSLIHSEKVLGMHGYQFRFQKVMGYSVAIQWYLLLERCHIPFKDVQWMIYFSECTYLGMLHCMFFMWNLFFKSAHPLWLIFSMIVIFLIEYFEPYKHGLKCSRKSTVIKIFLQAWGSHYKEKPTRPKRQCYVCKPIGQ